MFNDLATAGKRVDVPEVQRLPSPVREDALAAQKRFDDAQLQARQREQAEAAQRRQDELADQRRVQEQRQAEAVRREQDKLAERRRVQEQKQAEVKRREDQLAKQRQAEAARREQSKLAEQRRVQEQKQAELRRQQHQLVDQRRAEASQREQNKLAEQRRFEEKKRAELKTRERLNETIGGQSTPHKNSLDYRGETHVYAIRNPDGTVNKIGESAQGVRAGDGASIRAEQQVRKKIREESPGYTSEIRKTFDTKRDARDYETKVIERFRRLYGDNALPGNRTNR